MTKKLKGHSRKKFAQKSRNNWCVNGRGCGCIGTVDSGPQCAQSWDQTQTIKNNISCHIYCVYRCTHLDRTVTASRAVSNRESRSLTGGKVTKINKFSSAYQLANIQIFFTGSGASISILPILLGRIDSTWVQWHTFETRNSGWFDFNSPHFGWKSGSR